MSRIPNDPPDGTQPIGGCARLTSVNRYPTHTSTPPDTVTHGEDAGG